MDAFSDEAWHLIRLLAGGQWQAAEAMLKKNPEVLAERNPPGETPLLWLVIEDYVDAVRWLLEHGDTVNAASHSRSTPLIFAAELDYTEMLRTLLSFKPDVEMRSELGVRALDAAARNSASGETVQLLLEAGADPHGCDSVGETALHFAAVNCNTVAAVELLKAGANANARTITGECPIHNLAFHYRSDRRIRKRKMPKYLPDFVAGLAQYGGDPHARNDSGETALHKAAWSGSTDAVGHLLALGLDKLAADEFDQLPITVARSRGHAEIVRMLEST